MCRNHSCCLGHAAEYAWSHRSAKSPRVNELVCIFVNRLSVPGPLTGPLLTSILSYHLSSMNTTPVGHQQSHHRAFDGCHALCSVCRAAISTPHRVSAPATLRRCPSAASLHCLDLTLHFRVRILSSVCHLALYQHSLTYGRLLLPLRPPLLAVCDSHCPTTLGIPAPAGSLGESALPLTP